MLPQANLFQLWLEWSDWSDLQASHRDQDIKESGGLTVMYYVMRCWGWLPCRRQKWITSWICWHWPRVGSRRNPAQRCQQQTQEGSPSWNGLCLRLGCLTSEGTSQSRPLLSYRKWNTTENILAEDVLPLLSARCCSAAQLPRTLRPDPMHCCTPGFPLLHRLLLLTVQETWVRFLVLEDPLEERNGKPFQCSCLGNPMDRGAWWAAVHGVTKSQTRLSD